VDDILLYSVYLLLGKEVIVAGFRHENPDLNSLAYELDKEVDKIINLNDQV